MKRNESNRMKDDWIRKTNACIRKRHKNRKNIKNRIKTGKSKKDRRRSNKKHNQKSNRKEKAMNKHQSNKISMIEGVHAYLTEHENVIENAAGIKSAAESLQVKITEIRSKENERLNVLKGKTLAKEAFRKQIVTQGLSAAKRHRAFSREETQGFHLGTHRALPWDHTGLCPVLTNCALSGLALLITKGISVGKRHRALPCFDKLRPLIN